MKKHLGMTLIELMIVVAIVSILAAVVLPALTGTKVISDFKCTAGFKFTRDGKQIIGQNGGGVPCDEVKSIPGGRP